MENLEKCGSTCITPYIVVARAQLIVTKETQKGIHRGLENLGAL